MKALDRYLVRELAAPVFYSCLSLVFLILISDLFNDLDDILRNQTPLLIVLRYYLSLVPYAFIQTIPWASWLGVLFLLVNLGFHNETMAMKAAGLKITTIVKPVLFFGFLVGIIAFLVSDQVVPQTYRKANELRGNYIEKKKKKEPEKPLENVTYFSGKEQLYFFKTFSKLKGEVTGVVALWLAEDTREKIIAKRGVWSGTEWKFEGVTEYLMDSRGRILGEPKTYPFKIYPEVRFTPSELAAASSESVFLTYKELKQSIQKLKENGVRVDAEVVDLHYRLAAPWQGFVMMLIAVPLLARTTNRKLIAWNVLICVGLVFAYHVMGAVGLALGKAGKIFPFLSAWANNIAFAIGGFLALEKANY